MSYNLRGTTQIFAASGALVSNPTVYANLRMPDTYSAALKYAYNDRWDILGDFTWTNWSTIKDVAVINVQTFAQVGSTINFQFRDTYRIGVGANYKWDNALTVKLGLAVDKSPVTDAVRTTLLPDSDRTWLSFGGKYRFTQVDTLDFGYAHIFVKNGSINDLRGLGAGNLGNVSGTYKNKVDIVSIQYTHAF